VQTAQTLGIQILDLDVRTVDDVGGAFEAAQAWRADGLLVFGQATLNALSAQVSELAARNRLPAMYGAGFAVHDNGGLMSFSANWPSNYRQGAEYVDKILRGTRPADLPVVEPRQYDFIVNTKAAQDLGITFPPDAAAQVTQWIQ
jgi:putative ABC transport system substrate-binding protein